MIRSTWSPFLTPNSLHHGRIYIARARKNSLISREDLDAYVICFRESAFNCYDPVAEDVLVDICLHGVIEDYPVYLKSLSIFIFIFVTNEGYKKIKINI